MSGCAWVTLATNDTYSLGALVLGHSLKRVCTRHQLAIIITPSVSSSMREQLAKVFDVVHLVDVLDSQDAASLALLQRPDLGVTFTKIHCWNLTQFSKCVFLDADTLIMQNCDELMEREELSAAPDPGWPDCFNSGVFVFVPNVDTFKQLVQFATVNGSFDGGDQGLLNMYFNDWPTSDIRKHLSFLYNMCCTTTYTYLPALKYYGANIKIVHFIGANKPWLLGPSGAGMSTFTQAWWDTFQSSVVQTLNKDMTGLAGAFGSKEKSIIEEQWRKQNWEQGNIDFTGKDSFEKIWQKIMDAVNKPKSDGEKPAVPPVSKEIASQAIPEKEKADAPAPAEIIKNEKPEEANKADETKVASSLAVAVIATELPKQEQIPPVPVPTAVAPLPQPLPMPPPIPAQEQTPPKLPDLPKAATPEGVLPTSPILPNLAAEPCKVAEIPLSQGQPQGAGELAKIEDTLKMLEKQLEEQLKDETKETPLLATPKAPEETKKSDNLPSEPELSKVLASDQKQEPPKDLTAKEELPKTDGSGSESVKAESPIKTDKSQSDVSKVETTKVEGSVPEPTKAESLPDTKVESPKAEIPIQGAVKAEAPTVDSTKAEIAKADAPKTDSPKAEVPNVDLAKSDVQAGSLVPEAPKVPAQDVPQTPEPHLESPKAEIQTPLPANSQTDTTTTSPVSLQESAKDPKLQDTSAPAGANDSKKQSTPPKDQKSAKQQAPQPPSKNGNQKKSQPAPTTTHPLTEVPVESETTATKDGQQATQQPLSPPLSPDAPVEKAPESQVQPSTPTVSGPTPPITPTDVLKTDDPLQVKKDSPQPTGASSSPVDAPVPPKRKGKGNGQPQKPQNNGAKGKGKK